MPPSSSGWGGGGAECGAFFLHALLSNLATSVLKSERKSWPPVGDICIYVCEYNRYMHLCVYVFMFIHTHTYYIYTHMYVPIYILCKQFGVQFPTRTKYCSYLQYGQTHTHTHTHTRARARTRARSNGLSIHFSFIIWWWWYSGCSEFGCLHRVLMIWLKILVVFLSHVSLMQG
jgi:hypothetical protein